MPLTEDEIRSIVRQTIFEEKQKANDDMDADALKLVTAILGGFGIDADEKVAVREDFRYLRRFRLGAEKVTSVGITGIIMTLVGGFCSAFYLGIKMMLGK